MDVQTLTAAIRQVAPIEGVSATGVIWFLPEATEQQRADAQAIFDDWEDPPVQDWGGFIENLVSIDGFFAAVASSGMAAFITPRMAALGDGQEFQGAGDRLLTYWNSAPPALNATQRDELTALAEAHAIPVAINADNELAAL